MFSPARFRSAAILFALALAAPLAADPPAAVPAAPSIEDFAEQPLVGDPVLSPNGEMIAARVTDAAGERIGIWRRESGGWILQPRHISGGTFDLDTFRWGGDGRLLIDVYGFARMSGVGIIPFPVRRVISYDLATRETKLLGRGGGFLDQLIFIDPDGRYALLSSQHEITEPPSVQRVDLASGETVQVQPSRRGVWSWFTDGDGVVRVGIDYGERRTRIYYRAAAGAELTLLENRRNMRDESVIDMVRFVTNTNRGIMVTNAETGRFALYDYDFATDTRGAVLFEHPEVDVTTALFGEDGSVDGVVYEDDRPRVRWLKPELVALQGTIDRALPGKTNFISGRSRNGNLVLIYSSAADDPGIYYVLDRAARRMDPFISPYARLEGRAFAPVRAVRYRSRDGLDIRAYLTLPPGRPERGLPLVILPHGGPFVRDSWTFNPEVQFLASRGYAVLQPNFRGSTGYGRDFVERGYGQLGAGMIDDIDDGVGWLAEQGIVDRARVCIMGSSYGGYAAIWAAIRSPERYRCAISWAGPTDWRRMLRYDARYLLPQRYMREWRRHLEGEERVDLDAVSPLRQQARLTVPLLLGHGERDQRVPVDQSRDLVRALTRRNAQLESVFYPEAGHGFSKPSDSADFMRRIEAFLTRHNPPGPGPAAASSAPASAQ
jgi:dipeptidyl aminopeptidase/acylaminoacyl peptidase